MPGRLVRICKVFTPNTIVLLRIVSWFVKITTKITGVTYEVRSSKILEEDRGAILVLNHQSLLDGLGGLLIKNYKPIQDPKLSLLFQSTPTWYPS